MLLLVCLAEGLQRRDNSEVDKMTFRKWLQSKVDQSDHTYSSLARSSGIPITVLLSYQRGRLPRANILRELLYSFYIRPLDSEAEDYDLQWERAKKEMDKEEIKIVKILMGEQQ